jgi:hypothetical protein
MAKNRLDAFRRLFLYGGSKDERTQGLYDRAGYHTAIFLFIAFFLEISIKMFVFKQGIDQILSELVILALSGIFSVIQYVRFGLTVFENIRQKRAVRLFLFVLGIAVVPLLLYIPLLMKLPTAHKLLALGPIGYLIPLASSGAGVALILLLAQLVDFLAKRKNRKREGDE